MQESRRAYQFSLREGFWFVVALCLLLTAGRYFPQTVASLTFFVFSSGIALAIIGTVDRLMLRQPESRPTRLVWSAAAWICRPLEFAFRDDGSFRRAGLVFVVSLLTFVLVRRLFVFVGLWIVLFPQLNLSEWTQMVWREIRDDSVVAYGWFSVTYNLGAFLRWVLLFGTVSAGILCVGSVHRKTDFGGSLRRLLLFSPWWIVIEFSMLATLWMLDPRVVPETATGFVVGIFTWSMWHWSCWLNQQWLLRAAVPTTIIASIYLVAVLRLPKWLAFAIAPLFVPPVIMVCIAWSVAANTMF